MFFQHGSQQVYIKLITSTLSTASAPTENKTLFSFFGKHTCFHETHFDFYLHNCHVTYIMLHFSVLRYLLKLSVSFLGMLLFISASSTLLPMSRNSACTHVIHRPARIVGWQSARLIMRIIHVCMHGWQKVHCFAASLAAHEQRENIASNAWSCTCSHGFAAC